MLRVCRGYLGAKAYRLWTEDLVEVNAAASTGSGAVHGKAADIARFPSTADRILP